MYRSVPDKFPCTHFMGSMWQLLYKCTQFPDHELCFSTHGCLSRTLRQYSLYSLSYPDILRAPPSHSAHAAMPSCPIPRPTNPETSPSPSIRRRSRPTLIGWCLPWSVSAGRALLECGYPARTCCSQCRTASSPWTCLGLTTPLLHSPSLPSLSTPVFTVPVG